MPCSPLILNVALSFRSGEQAPRSWVDYKLPKLAAKADKYHHILTDFKQFVHIFLIIGF
jgi:hypothetical protein